MRAVGLLLLALTAAASALSAEESYVIRLTRPRQVGDLAFLEMSLALKGFATITGGWR
jgi:hypothetical protein